jgi:hypothetical protein
VQFRHSADESAVIATRQTLWIFANEARQIPRPDRARYRRAVSVERDPKKERSMRWILAVATLVLATLVVEDKARQVAGDAQNAYGKAVDHARDSTETVGRSVEQQPLVAVLIATGIGYVLARLMPRR